MITSRILKKKPTNVKLQKKKPTKSINKCKKHRNTIIPKQNQDIIDIDTKFNIIDESLYIMVWKLEYSVKITKRLVHDVVLKTLRFWYLCELYKW